MRRIDYNPFVGDGRMRIEPSPVDTFGALPNTQPMSLTLAQARSAIARIMLHGGRSTHSGQGGTLWVILTYLQHHAIPYELKAMPGHWYEVKLIEDPTKEPVPTAFPTEFRDAGGLMRAPIIPAGYERVWHNKLGVALYQRKQDDFCVQYCLQVRPGLTYGQAAMGVGRALMHALACESKLDNGG